jgi:phage tail protein X
MGQVRVQQGDTVDVLCWRYYGRTAGVTEALLLANPGLADIGPVLPHGHLVDLPEITIEAERKMVQLWT